MGGNAKAIIINAGLGDLTFSLEAAGFRVEAVYEEDSSASAIHQANFGIPVCSSLPRGEEIWNVPQADLLAVRLNLRMFQGQRRAETNTDPALFSFLEVMEQRRPEAFLVVLNAGAAQGDWHHLLGKPITQMGYWSAWEMLDTAQITGFPVKERKMILMGAQEGKAPRFGFPEIGTPISEPPEMFLEPSQQIDPWYFHIRPGGDVPLQEGMRFYCRIGNGYEGTSCVGWNPRSTPLVLDGGVLRKITHREIANLKGFPRDYSLPVKNKSWLYQKLMYAGNVIVLRQVAENIRYALEKRLWYTNQAQSFEELLGHYLAGSGKLVPGQKAKSEPQPDFVLNCDRGRLLIEAKSYRSAVAPESRLTEACKRLQSISEEGIRVLAVANVVPYHIKSRILEEYGIHIWDVANLLWLFDGQEDIRNEFVALLGYTVESIQPEPPDLNPFRLEQPEPPDSDGTTLRLDWKKRLDGIVPGQKQAGDYERLCVELLKSVLNTYLTLWKTQEPSNDGLYRFDLCCKIKMGADRNSDFFDTIQRYFNTKYIVFEFKNYSEQITQKEIYTTEKYLYEKALRKVAVIISRKGADRHAERAARGCLRETGKLILCLSDDDLLKMNALEEHGEGNSVDVFGEKLDTLLIDLEK